MVYLELICPHCSRISPFNPMEELWEQWCIRCGHRLQSPLEVGPSPAAPPPESPGLPTPEKRLISIKSPADEIDLAAPAGAEWFSGVPLPALDNQAEPEVELDPWSFEGEPGNTEPIRPVGSLPAASGGPDFSPARRFGVPAIAQTTEMTSAVPDESPARHNWLLASVLIVTGMAAAAYLGFTLADGPANSSAGPAQPPAAAEIPPREQARAVISKFLKARTPDELLSSVRNPGIWDAALRKWCSARSAPLPLGGSITAQKLPRNTLGYRVLESSVELGDGTASVILCVESPDGWQIDWMSFAKAGAMTLAEFLASRPEKPVTIPVMAQFFSYHNGPFADPERYRCLRLTDDSNSLSLYGYVDVKAVPPVKLPAGIPAFDTTSRRAQPRLPMTLTMRFPEGSSPGAVQVEITGITGEGWFVP